MVIEYLKRWWQKPFKRSWLRIFKRCYPIISTIAFLLELLP
jgi:hypothetical protein